MVKAFVEEGIKVNMMACLPFGQVVPAAKAGATSIGIFASVFPHTNGHYVWRIRLYR